MHCDFSYECDCTGFPKGAFLPGGMPCAVRAPTFLDQQLLATLDMHFAIAVLDFDGLNGVFKRFCQNASADGPNHEAEQLSLDVLAVAYDDHVNVGRAVRLTR